MNVNIRLGGMFLQDYLYNYKDTNWNSFITSKINESSVNNELIKLDVLILEKGHPDYKNVGLDIDVNFDTLIVHFKPETLAKVLLFIKPDQIGKQYINIFTINVF